MILTNGCIVIWPVKEVQKKEMPSFLQATREGFLTEIVCICWLGKEATLVHFSVFAFPD